MTKRILHICNHRAEWDDIEDVCAAVMRCLDSEDEIEQRVFSLVAPHPAQYIERLRGELHRFRPEFIHFHTPDTMGTVCLPAVIPRRVKLIVHWHADNPLGGHLYTLIKPFEAALLRRADVIVGSSTSYIEASRALTPHLAKCVVIPGIVEVSRLVPSPTRLNQIRWRYGDKPLLLFTGRHVLHTGLDSLMAAMSGVRHDCRVMVGGEGPLTARLKRDHLSEQIHFAGRIPPDDLAAWYTAADLFLFPSTTRDEAFGLALAKAMWCGTPAVTFTIPGSGVNWVSLNGVTGIEVDNGNTEQLAAAIDHLLTHDDMRHEYGTAARQRIEEHMTPERVTPALAALYA
jgi:glycosyltransferase involved in cell wall biosynthesis